MSAARQNNPDELPPKRMRLGTRSCAECRRRKTRCVYPNASGVCESCAVHNVPCKAQQPKRDGTRTIEHEGKDALEKRIDGLEGMIRQLCASVAIDSSPGSNSSEPNLSQSAKVEYLGRVLQARMQSTSPNYRGLSLAATTPDSSVGGANHTSDALHQFGDTPLITLFKEALLLKKGDASGPKQYRLETGYRDILSRMVPSANTLEQIFITTQDHWCIWPPCYFESQRLQEASCTTMLSFFLVSLDSGIPALVAKSLIWLALCIFELPREWTTRHPDVAQPDALISALAKEAQRCLSIAAEYGDTIDSIEALGLLIKLSIDLGTPRKGWLAARQAVNASLLLGLHRKRSAEDEREQALWRFILHAERETSLLLGVASSVPIGVPSLLPSSENLYPLEQLMLEMTKISGAVAERNQGNLETSYSKTMELDQAFEDCKKVMPDDFWRAELPVGISFRELYYRQTLKIRFFIIGKLIHLPYMLKSAQNRRYALSRTSAVDMSREIIVAYQTLRMAAGPELAPCGLMDFESFAASSVLAIDLMQQRSLKEPDMPQSAQDMELLAQFLSSLRQASTFRDCTVAERAANVLERILSVLQGHVWGQRFGQECDVTIPFFGRLRIEFPEIISSVATSSSISVDSRNQTTSLPAVVFGTPTFDQDMFSNFDFEAELNGDWSSNFELDDNFDWVTVFQPN